MTGVIASEAWRSRSGLFQLFVPRNDTTADIWVLPPSRTIRSGKDHSVF